MAGVNGVSGEILLEPLLRQLRTRQVIPLIPVGSTLLDIGCGRAASFLKIIAPRITLGIGIDSKVEPMQDGKIQTLPLKLVDQLPFASASFDVVTLLAVLEHLEQEQQILQEIYRVLKPNGKLVITVPSIWAQPLLEFLSYLLKIINEQEIRDHKRYYNRQRLWEVLVVKSQFRNFHHVYFQCWMNNCCTVMK